MDTLGLRLVGALMLTTGAAWLLAHCAVGR